MSLIEWSHYGPQAVLLRFASKVGEEAFQRSRAIVADLEDHPPHGLVEYVPAFTSILLEFHPQTRTDLPRIVKSLVARLENLPARSSEKVAPKKIPVRYDGPDLDRVAKRSGLSVEEVKRRHAGRVYRVYMLGFSPGFPYLGDLDPCLHTPRLDTPRPRVPAGAVAIGGEHTGIYSIDSPGGWNIIGHTEVALVKTLAGIEACDGRAVFFLKPGDRVQFVPCHVP